MEAVVEFDYIAQEPDELTLHKGDILHNINPQPGGWWEGTLNDKRGMFPDNFIQIVDKDSDVTYRHRNKVKRQCRAIFSYSAVHDDELSLNVGEVIDILGEVEEGWWRGQLNDKEGVFPSNFVQEIHIAAPLSAHRQKKVVSSKEDLTSIAGETDQNVPSLPPKPVKILCQVQYPYEACNDDELTLRVGDVITLISKDGQDKGWWRGELRGQVGVFPDNFVTVITLSSDASKQNTDKKPDRPPSSKISPGQLPGIKKEIVTRPIPNVVVQRKSLEVKSESPPIPGKKPTVPIKKSPSLTGSTGGIFSGLKQKVIGLEHKILDSTDGIGSSKPPLPKEEQPIVQKEEQPSDKHNEFDQVERSGLLSDPRANRAKAPGRRPPSMVLRDADPGMTNGNVEHPMSITPIIDENLETDNKRKQRDWEKHRAPWMDELKLNQAKKTSPLNPSPDSASRLKFTSPSEQSHLKLSNEKLDSHDETGLDSSKSKPDNEMTKSMSAITSRIRNSTPELPEIVKTGVSFRSGQPKHALKRVQTFGKRKTSIAVATVTKSAQCNIKINGIPIRQIPNETLRSKIMDAIHTVGAVRYARLKINVTVRGGGQVSQMYASRQAIAKGLVAYLQKYSNETQKMDVKSRLLAADKALLVADPRRCEAKKWGRHSARTRFTKSYR